MSENVGQGIENIGRVARFHRLKHLFGLSDQALGILNIAHRLDVDGVFAKEVEERDPHQRKGCLSWRLLVQRWGEEAIGSTRHAVSQLMAWGILQAVGSEQGDPTVPGSTALRLTYFGRQCLEGGPYNAGAFESTGPLPPSDVFLPWQILHGASREALLAWILTVVEETKNGWSPRPIVFADTSLESKGVSRLKGQIASQIFFEGATVIDAHWASQQNAQQVPVLARLLLDMPRARAPRYLLLADPAGLRYEALASDAKLSWVPPRVEARRGNVILSEAIGERMQRDGVDTTSCLGVPDSKIAEPRWTQVAWDDLVLSLPLKARLSLCRSHAQYRIQTVHKSQILGRGGRGYRLLLSGPPGTGKSMIAEALASELEKPILRFDLSSVLSRWLGETEKLIGEVFDQGEAADALIIMDEADAVMQPRRNVGQSGGALVTGVAYLLTRFEHYQGVLVATTNRTDDMDAAFFRRFDDYVIVPLPDAATRHKLWRKMLTDRSQGLEATLQQLAQNFAIGGALIQGTVLRALAWERGGAESLDGDLLLASLVCELEKSNRGGLEMLSVEQRRRVQETLTGRRITNDQGKTRVTAMRGRGHED